MASACRACPLAADAVWAGAPAASVLGFRKARGHLSLRRGAVLFRQGEAVEALYVLLSGAVVLYRPGSRQRPVAMHLVMPGRAVGFRALVEGQGHRSTARCVADSVLCRVPVAAAEAAFAAHRPLEQVFLRDLGDELALMRDRLLQISGLGVRDRLVLTLERLLPSYGAPVSDGWLIINPLGRADMAALAGMTPETISRCIRHLQDENLAHFSRKSILLPSRQRFSDELALIRQRS